MFNKPNVLIQNHESIPAIFLQSANACSSAFNVHQHHNYPLCKSNMFLHFKTLYFHPWRGSISNTDFIIKYNQAHVFAGLLDIILQSAMNQKKFLVIFSSPHSKTTLCYHAHNQAWGISKTTIYFGPVRYRSFFVVAVWRRALLNALPGGQKLYFDTTARLCTL